MFFSKIKRLYQKIRFVMIIDGKKRATYLKIKIYLKKWDRIVYFKVEYFQWIQKC